MVCDRTREGCRIWQLISFPKRAVVFIRIVGTHNTTNEMFHCVHFVAPAMSSKLGSGGSAGSQQGQGRDARQQRHRQ